MSRAGDQSFWGIGIPSVFMALGEQPAGEGESVMGPAIGGGGSRKGAGFGWWWHTPDDTIDKIDPDLLVRDVRIYVHTIGRLLTDDVLPLDIGRQADALARELSAVDGGLARTAGSWLAANGRGSIACRGPADPDGRRRPGRPGGCDQRGPGESVPCALVPMDYTSGDRFQPDPALKQGAYPGPGPRSGACRDDARVRCVPVRKRCSPTCVEPTRGGCRGGNRRIGNVRVMTGRGCSSEGAS